MLGNIVYDKWSHRVFHNKYWHQMEVKSESGAMAWPGLNFGPSQTLAEPKPIELFMVVDAYQTYQTSRTTFFGRFKCRPCHDTSSRHGIAPRSSVN